MNGGRGDCRCGGGIKGERPFHTVVDGAVNIGCVDKHSAVVGSSTSSWQIGGCTMVTKTPVLLLVGGCYVRAGARWCHQIAYDDFVNGGERQGSRVWIMIELDVVGCHGVLR